MTDKEVVALELLERIEYTAMIWREKAEEWLIAAQRNHDEAYRTHADARQALAQYREKLESSKNS